MKKLYITFDDIKSELEDYKFADTIDVILCLTRGGLVPSGLISYKIECKDIINLKISSYEKEEQHNINLTPLNDKDLETLINAKHILVVDDIYDSGNTMNAVFSYLGDALDKANSVAKVSTFCIVTKQKNRVDYSLFDCDLGTWVVFPWDFE